MALSICKKELRLEIIKGRERRDSPEGKGQQPGQWITPRLAQLLMDLVENYARKSKWAWVSEDIKEEAKQNALVKLVKGVLKYDPEAKKSSAFSYCTTFCERAFIDALNDNAKRLERNAIIERELTMIWTPSHGRKIGVPARESSDGMDGFGN